MPIAPIVMATLQFYFIVVCRLDRSTWLGSYGFPVCSSIILIASRSLVFRSSMRTSSEGELFSSSYKRSSAWATASSRSASTSRCVFSSGFVGSLGSGLSFRFFLFLTRSRRCISSSSSALRFVSFSISVPEHACH
jgi:hypothetical protein